MPFPLVGCHIIKGFSLVRAVLRRCSATVRVEQHRHQEMFPLVGCHSHEGFSLVHFCSEQVGTPPQCGCSSKGSKKCSYWTLVGCNSLKGFSLVHAVRYCAGNPPQCGCSSTGSKKCSHWSAATHLKGSHWSYSMLRRYSATVRVQQHRQLEMFQLVGCHSLKVSHWSTLFCAGTLQQCGCSSTGRRSSTR
jgi:hypothetical protein